MLSSTTHISDSEEEPELRLPPTKHIKLDKSLHQPSAPISPPYSLDTNRSISRNVNQQLTQLEKRVASLEMQVSKGFERVFGELEEMKELLTKNLTGSAPPMTPPRQSHHCIDDFHTEPPFSRRKSHHSYPRFDTEPRPPRPFSIHSNRNTYIYGGDVTQRQMNRYRMLRDRLITFSPFESPTTSP